MTEIYNWVLDFEASGLSLPASYPIEVGYTNGTLDREFIVFPVESWNHWDTYAEENIHHISKMDTLKYGIKPKSICEIMNADLHNQIVWVDGGIYDEYWMNRLFDAARMNPSFVLRYFNSNGLVDDNNTKHRALADAKELWAALNKKTENNKE